MPPPIPPATPPTPSVTRAPPRQATVQAPFVLGLLVLYSLGWATVLYLLCYSAAVLCSLYYPKKFLRHVASYTHSTHTTQAFAAALTLTLTLTPTLTLTLTLTLT